MNAEVLKSDICIEKLGKIERYKTCR